MKYVYFLGLFFLSIDILMGFYISNIGGTEAALKSGIVGNLSVFTIFITVGVYVPVLIWSLAENKK